MYGLYRTWTLDEDILLFKLVASNIKNEMIPKDTWSKIASHLARTENQCSTRYKNLDSLLRENFKGTKRKLSFEQSGPPEESEAIYNGEEEECKYQKIELKDSQESEFDSGNETEESEESEILESSEEDWTESSVEDKTLETFYSKTDENAAIAIVKDEEEYFINLYDLKLEFEISHLDDLFGNQTILQKIYQNDHLGEFIHL